MSFSLPELPYPHDALAPYMSRETLEYHHDKHHLAYVDNGNKLAKGTEWENEPVEEVVNQQCRTTSRASSKKRSPPILAPSPK